MSKAKAKVEAEPEVEAVVEEAPRKGKSLVDRLLAFGDELTDDVINQHDTLTRVVLNNVQGDISHLRDVIRTNKALERGDE